MSGFDEDLSMEKQLEKRINTFKKTRGARIEMSSRLKKYAEQWKIITFILNVEAVIFVLFSIGGATIGLVNQEGVFALAAGIFSIYVILVQSYIGELKYSERSLKLHYHQLDIEDLILKLRKLRSKANDEENTISEEELLEQYHYVLNEYQTVMKNNENHAPVDFEKTITKDKKHSKDIDKDKVKDEGEEKDKKKEKWDFTIDNIVLTFNLILVMVLPVIFFIL